MKLTIICVVSLLASAPALADTWGKAIAVSRTGEGRALPETAAQTGAAYKSPPSAQQEMMLDFIGAMRGLPETASLLPDTAQVAVATGSFPSPTDNGHVSKSAISVGELRKLFAECTFGDFRSLGNEGPRAFGMISFDCPKGSAAWRHGSIGLSQTKDDIDFVINIGDLPNIHYGDPK